MGGNSCRSFSRSSSASSQPMTLPGFAMSARRGKPRSVPLREALGEFRREFAQAVVARAHDDDAVAVASLGKERFADRRAVRDMIGLPSGGPDLLGEPVGTAALLDRAALIDRIGQVQAVFASETLGETLGQFLAHLRQRAVAVWLEHH